MIPHQTPATSSEEAAAGAKEKLLLCGLAGAAKSTGLLLEGAMSPWLNGRNLTKLAHPVPEAGGVISGTGGSLSCAGLK